MRRHMADGLKRAFYVSSSLCDANSVALVMVKFFLQRLEAERDFFARNSWGMGRWKTCLLSLLLKTTRRF
jgi:hypothetical protein